jgi:hypothetical protein
VSSHVVGEDKGVVIYKAVARAAEIAEKGRIAVQAQKQAVNAGMSSGLFSSSLGFTLLWFNSCVRIGV